MMAQLTTFRCAVALMSLLALALGLSCFLICLNRSQLEVSRIHEGMTKQEVVLILGRDYQGAVSLGKMWWKRRDGYITVYFGKEKTVRETDFYQCETGWSLRDSIASVLNLNR